MSEEPDFSSLQAAGLSGGKRRIAKLTAIGATVIAVVVIAVFAGKSFLSKETEKPEHSDQALSLQLSLPENTDTAGLAELLFDSLELTDILSPTDTIELPLAQLTGTQIDSSEYIEIPGIEYLDDTGLLNAALTGDEIEFDSTLDIELAITSPMRPGMDFPMPHFGVKPTESIDEVKVDTAAILAAYQPKVGAVGQTNSDSLARIVHEKEQALQMLAAHNQELSDKLIRYHPKIDSTRSINIKRLGKIIETMSPAAAASMLASNSSDEITEILFKVKPRKAAQILQQLPPNKASEIALRVVRE